MLRFFPPIISILFMSNVYLFLKCVERYDSFSFNGQGRCHVSILLYPTRTKSPNRLGHLRVGCISFFSSIRSARNPLSNSTLMNDDDDPHIQACACLCGSIFSPQFILLL